METPIIGLLGKHFVSALAVFDPRNVPSTDSSLFPTYGKTSIEDLFNYFGKDKFPLTLNDEERLKTVVISPEVHTEWIAYRTLLAKKPEDSIAMHLKELITNVMQVAMFPNIQKIASFGVTLPVSAASERNFSQMKLIKTCLRTLSPKAVSLS